MAGSRAETLPSKETGDLDGEAAGVGGGAEVCGVRGPATAWLVTAGLLGARTGDEPPGAATPPQAPTASRVVAASPAVIRVCRRQAARACQREPYPAAARKCLSGRPITVFFARISWPFVQHQPPAAACLVLVPNGQAIPSSGLQVSPDKALRHPATIRPPRVARRWVIGLSSLAIVARRRKAWSYGRSNGGSPA